MKTILKATRQCIILVAAFLLGSPAVSAQASIRETLQSLGPSLRDDEYHGHVKIDAEVIVPDAIREPLSVYSARQIPFRTACDLDVFSSHDVVKADQDFLLDATIYDFSDGSWVNMTDGGMLYYFGPEGDLCSSLRENAEPCGEQEAQSAASFGLEEAERRLMEQIEKMGIPNCTVTERAAYHQDDFDLYRFRLGQVVGGVPLSCGLLHMMEIDKYVVGNTLDFTLSNSGFQIIDVMGAYEGFESLYTVTEVVPLQDALETLRAHMDVLWEKDPDLRDQVIDRIAFEYVPYRYANPQGASSYELLPAWHFYFSSSLGTSNRKSFDFCVNAIDGRMLVY